jgi:50S ribosomal protein L16 3-hydroxylase
LSEPKAQVWFQAQPSQDISSGVVLDRKTKMLYDDRCVYINGESWRCAGEQAKSLRLLADKKFLSSKQIQTASTVLSELLQNWLQAGWLHVMRVEK